MNKLNIVDAKKSTPKIRFRKASSVLNAHYREKAKGSTNAVRPPGVLLGGLLWVDMTTVVRDDDTAWNNALEEARRSVVANFEEIGRGLFAARFKEPVAGTPLLFPETLVGLGLEGGPAVLLPHSRLLLVCGLNDEQALIEMGRFADELESPVEGCLTKIPLTRDENGKWTRLVAERRFDSLRVFRDLRLQELSEDYAEQKSALEAVAPDVKVGEYELEQIIRGSTSSVTTLYETDSQTLLPRTAYVKLAATDGEVVPVEFRKLHSVMKGLMLPQGTFPERYLVRGFPGPKERQALRVG